MNITLAQLRAETTTCVAIAAHDAGLLPKAIRDAVNRLLDLGVELRPSGEVRLTSGGDLLDGLLSLQAVAPHLFNQATIDASAPPTATQKLGKANGDTYHPS